MRRLARFFYNLLLSLVFSNAPNNIGQKVINGRMQFIWLNEHVGRKIKFSMFERKESLFFASYLQPGDICLDVGANVGYFTGLFAGCVGKTGKVVAVEPVRRNALLIELASELNNTSEVVQVICAAVSSKDGFIEMAGEEDSSYSSVKIGDTIGKGRTKAITIDHLVEEMNLSRVDILKMDIEGWEYHALQGMSALLANRSTRPRMMMVELYSSHLQRYGSSIDEVCHYLNGYGYEPYVLNRDSILIKYALNHRNIIYNVFFVDSGRNTSR